jgi:UDP-glucose 4-epimerase
MNVLVTGGAGFIGSHLVGLLLSNGHTVTVLDDLSTGKRENLQTTGSGLHLHVGDVADPNALEMALRGQDAVVHLAAVASVEASVRDPVGTHRTNLEGSIRLFDMAARLGVRRVLYASSAAVYGDSQALPLGEDSEKRPLTPYAADKLAGEHYLGHYHRSGALDGTAFRFFNVFGPRQDPTSPYSGVISIFLDRAKRGEKMTVFGDGEQTRDFIFVTDVVNALHLALLGPARPQEELPVYNVGRGTEVSLLQLLDLIGSLPGVGPLHIDFKAPRVGDILRSVADVSRLRATGWQPNSRLDEGLRQTLFSV